MGAVALKQYGAGKNIIYVHMNRSGRYILSSGIRFPEFIRAVPVKPSNMLLLCREYEEGYFNMRTRFNYVAEEGIGELLEEHVYRSGNFCWTDFSEEESLDEITDQELAELLFIGHTKSHLKPPFYRMLGNRYVYLTEEDGFLNKTYYKNWDHFYSMLGVVLAGRSNLSNERSFFGRRKNRTSPFIPIEVVQHFNSLMGEGVVFSLERARIDRSMIEIPAWIVGDYLDMDDMLEEYGVSVRKSPDGRLLLDRKTGEWTAVMA